MINFQSSLERRQRREGREGGSWANYSWAWGTPNWNEQRAVDGFDWGCAPTRDPSSEGEV